MSDIKVGDRIFVRQSVYWNGTDIGWKDGTVISVEGHILVNLDNWQDNPVKLFRSEVSCYPIKTSYTKEWENE